MRMLFDRKNYYGQEIHNYPIRIDRIVDGAVEEMRAKTQHPQALFFRLLEELAQERRKLADDQKTANAHLFGLRRDSDEALEANGPIFITTLEGAFKEDGRRLAAELEALPQSGRKTDFEWERVPFNVLCQRQMAFFEHPEMRSRISIDKSKTGFKEYCSATDPRARREFYQTCLETYRAIKLPLAFAKGDSYFFASLFNSRNGRRIPLTQYLIAYSQFTNQDPILIHHDFYFIQGTLEWASELFADCLKWTQPEGLNALKKRAAHLSYLFAHAMPFCRGSAAIREWLEMAIFRYHGYRVSYTEGNALDLEAFMSWSYKNYLKQYNLD